MVLQKAVDNLKDKPKEDRKAIAGGIAITIVVLLLAGWTFLFFKKIQRGGELQLGGSAQDEFLGSSVREAQKDLIEGFSGFDELKRVREQSAERYQPAQEQGYYQQSETDAFGRPSGSD